MELARCRFSPTAQFLSPPIFRSLACAHCLFYIYFVTPPYSQNYKTTFCGASGLLICPLMHAHHSNDHSLSDYSNNNFNANCNCENSPNKIYNIPEYFLNDSIQSIETLKLTPNLPNDFFLIVKQCCEAAEKCCKNTLSQDVVDYFKKTDNDKFKMKMKKLVLNENQITTKNHFNNVQTNQINNDVSLKLKSGLTCPATWDGWHCFERAEPGQINAKCPNYIFGDRIRHDLDGLIMVKKLCLLNGEWYTIKRKNSFNEWTDYSGCVSNNAYTIKLFSGFIAFTITVITIIPALFIFSFHRSLKNQPMFIIHRQLLYSFLFSGIFYIFNSLFFAIDGAPGDHLYFMNHISCRLLFTVQLRYFRLSTFSWMLGEGVYLYRFLMCTFSTGIEPLRPYFILCWGFPFVITIIYSLLRQTFDNEECWITPTKYWSIEWTIIGPCLISLSINLLLMLVIFWVLIKKLRCNPNLEPAQYTKAVRAVFMLVPVFGLHFLITIYRIQSYIHQIVNLVLDGLQGFMVTLIVCYTNRTVTECMKVWIQQKLEARQLRRQSEDHRLKFKRSLQENNSSIYRNNTSQDSNKSRLSRLSSSLRDKNKNKRIDKIDHTIGEDKNNKNTKKLSKIDKAITNQTNCNLANS